MPGFGTWKSTLRSELSICSSFLYCGSAAEALQHRAFADGLQEIGVAERDVQRDHQGHVAGVVLDLDPLGLERGELRGRVGALRHRRLELAVDLAVRAVAHDGELVRRGRR